MSRAASPHVLALAAVLDVEGLRAAVLGWAESSRRDLPWRRTRDPWAILVSELMLQQTQVARVVPRYQAFLERFPTPPDCAVAPAGEVIDAWAGLGYNRRAVNLHRAAAVVTAEHGGRLPQSLAELQALPGIGPYTARAVLVFAHEADVGVVDTNVARLLARWTGEALPPRRAQELADQLVPPGRAWSWNQGLFDLGSAVCTARRPACDHCSASRFCAWRGRGRDPASPSPRQPAFEGSDRQGRGRLVDALRGAPVAASELAGVMGWPDDPDRARRVAATLVADGLAALTDGGRTWRLPGS